MTIRYAKALFELATDENISETLEYELEEINGIIQENPDIISILDCPGIDDEARQNIIADCFSVYNKYILNLLYILTEKRQMHLFFSLVQEYRILCGIEHIIAVSAVPMTQNELKKLEIVLQKKRNKRIELENKVDPSILGGVILKFPDSVTDASLKGRLEKAKYDLHKEKKYGY